MHADSLLAGRDLVRRSRVGHVDLPRLQEGGVGLQIFTSVTVVPLGLNIERNERGAFDLITLLGLAQLSPRRLARGLLGRARAAGRSSRERDRPRARRALMPVRSRADLDAAASRGAPRVDRHDRRAARDRRRALRSKETSRTSTSSSIAAFA